MPEIIQYGFMVRALAAGLMIGTIAPTIGVFLVLRRLSLIADTLAHVALAGVALALLTGIHPVAGALGVALLGAVGVERLRVSGRVIVPPGPELSRRAADRRAGRSDLRRCGHRAVVLFEHCRRRGHRGLRHSPVRGERTAGAAAMIATQTPRAVSAALLVAALVFGGARVVSAQEPTEAVPPDQFFRGTVVEVLEERVGEVVGAPQLQQVVVVELAVGGGTRQRVRAEFTAVAAGGTGQALRVGDAVIAVQSPPPDQSYFVVDRDRSRPLIFLAVAFFALAVLLGRLRGATSLLGLAITVAVIVGFVVPSIVAGASPLFVSILGALAIAVASIYLAHGFSRRTTIAVASTLITLTLSAFLAAAAVSLARLFGSGTEEASYLQLGLLKQVNLRGLLLGGIILGAVGVLDDITTGQAAAVDEIHKANPALPVRELYWRGRSVGTEHITSLVNTLFLAYAGASLPLFILFTVNGAQPLWVTLSSEFIAEEIVRTIVGSIALILGVPITTLMAAYVLGRQ